uniref:Cyclin-dependent protein kinase inhibitor SMR1-like n=1 Tax=Ananas comosus var. bracteatus TaxID=296719 RepID=A0A6V7NR49_ANACO|nr:unnamed protein product [Ananas comosus var. bracteatus]
MSASPSSLSPPIATARSHPVQDQGRNDASPPTVDGDDSGECRTPTAEASKLPAAARICPPAPRKSRRVVLCKRRLSVDFELISVEMEELENLFRVNFAGNSINERDAKRRKICMSST